MSEGQSKHRFSVPSTGIVGIPPIAISLLLATSMNVWPASVHFLAATAAVGAWIGMLFGRWRVGAGVGLLLGALHIAFLFSSLENGGHWPDMPGWPIMVPLF